MAGGARKWEKNENKKKRKLTKVEKLKNEKKTEKNGRETLTHIRNCGDYGNLDHCNVIPPRDVLSLRFDNPKF